MAEEMIRPGSYTGTMYREPPGDWWLYLAATLLVSSMLLWRLC